VIPWEQIDAADIPGSDRALRLRRRGGELSISIDGVGELMNSRLHGSEEALAEIGCAHLAGTENPAVLIGGLGMGFTLAAALRLLGSGAEVVVAELIPAVVGWNRGVVGELTGRPLDDPRVRVHAGDVATLLKKGAQSCDAILLDVDNGPAGLTRRGNDWLYSLAGLAGAFAALRPGGVLAVWSAGADRDFTGRLRKVGFDVEEVKVRARKSGKGAHHVIWRAQR